MGFRSQAWTRRLLASVWTLLLTVSAFPLLGVNAEEPTPPQDNTVTVEDPADDVTVYVAPGAGGPTTPGSTLGEAVSPADILKVVVGEETAADFKVHLQLKALESANPGGTPQRTVSFNLGGQNWRLQYGRCSFGGGQTPVGCLQISDQGRGWRTQRYLNPDLDLSQREIIFTVNKRDLYNLNHVPPRYGDALTNLTASTTETLVRTGTFFGDPVGGVVARDRAPDADYAKPFTFRLGSTSHGDLELISPDPIRVSNGEATTLVYKIQLTNRGTRTHTVELSAQGMRQGWSVRVPTQIKILGGDNVTLPVVVGVPFTHDHGETATFQVTARSMQLPVSSYATVDLGLYWTAIPQPSGHHGGLQWFHSAPADNPQLPDELETYLPTVVGWINGNETDPDPTTTDQTVPGSRVQDLWAGPPAVPPVFAVQWFFPLAPPLLMGMDFDLAKTGKVNFDLIPTLTATAATATIRLHYCDPNRDMGGNNRGPAPCNVQAPVMAEGTWTGSLSPNTPAHVSADLTVKPEYDLVVYKRDVNIGLSVFLATDVPQTVPFTNQPAVYFKPKDAQLELNLLEYHDPVDQAFQAIGSLGLTVMGEIERYVNPGRTALFYFDLTNNDTSDHRVQLEVEGVNAKWGEIVGATERTVPAGGNLTVPMALRVPKEVLADTRIDLVVVAEDQDDPAVVATARVLSLVVTEIDVPDDADKAAALDQVAGKSPGFEWLLLVAGLGAVALSRRRSTRR